VRCDGDGCGGVGDERDRQYGRYRVGRLGLDTIGIWLSCRMCVMDVRTTNRPSKNERHNQGVQAKIKLTMYIPTPSKHMFTTLHH
jgi:hypothetical protein